MVLKCHRKCGMATQSYGDRTSAIRWKNYLVAKILEINYEVIWANVGDTIEIENLILFL